MRTVTIAYWKGWSSGVLPIRFIPSPRLPLAHTSLSSFRTAL